MACSLLHCDAQVVAASMALHNGHQALAVPQEMLLEQLANRVGLLLGVQHDKAKGFKAATQQGSGVRSYGLL